MFGEFVRQWCRLVCGWLPSEQKDQRESQAGVQPKAAESQPASSTAPSTAPGSTGEKTSAEDDLTTIKGIGPTMDNRLRAIGIRTFRDLAAADPQEVARQLNSRPVTAERVAEWMAEAKKRA